MWRVREPHVMDPVCPMWREREPIMNPVCPMWRVREPHVMDSLPDVACERAVDDEPSLPDVACARAYHEPSP